MLGFTHRNLCIFVLLAQENEGPAVLLNLLPPEPELNHKSCDLRQIAQTGFSLVG